MGEAFKLEDLVPNAQLKHYIIMEHIADGGMGHVYRAFEPALQREVAIKVLKPELAANRSHVEFFEEEAKNIAALRHPNIVPIYYIDQSGDLCFFVMAYIAGHVTLDNWVEANTPINAEDALWVMRQAVEALDWAFKSNIIHLDIKPSNFLVDDSGSIFLTDFGLARSIATNGPSDRNSSECYGTPAYMCPEQVLNKPTDQRSDIYSLGATLYHLLTMQFLHDGNTLEEILVGHVKDPFPYEQAKAAGLSPGWINLLDRMTQKDPAARFQNYEELRNAINNIERVAPVQNAVPIEKSAELQPVPHRGTGKKEELYGLLAKSASTWASAGIDTGFKKTKSQILDLIIKPMSPLAIGAFTKASLELQEDAPSEIKDLTEALALLHDLESYITALAKTKLCNPSQVAVNSTKEAIEIIGTSLVHSLILTNVILKKDGPKSKEFNWTPLLQHSINTGVIATQLLDFLDRGEQERSLTKMTVHFISSVTKAKSHRLAYFAGFIHDLGTFVLGEAAPYSLYATMRLCMETHKSLPIAEKEMLGVDHAEIGEVWASKYPFESSIKETLRHHHSPTTKNSRLCAAVFVANQLAKRHGQGFSGNSFIEIQDFSTTPAWEILVKSSSRPQITIEQFETEFAQLVAEIPLLSLDS